MIFRVPTNYEEFTLVVPVKTEKPERIHIILKDESLPNTVYTDRSRVITGTDVFYIRVPVSGKSALLLVYNDRIGNVPKAGDSTFQVNEKDIKKIPLEKKLDAIDVSNPDIQSWIRFCTKFCFNAGHLTSGNYQSKDGKFLIEYLPVITSSNTGKELNTPARISKTSGRIQVAQKKFVPMTFPMRMVIMMHEFSHYYANDDINNESEADLNALMIYLGLGYPRIEAHEAFLKTFIGCDTPENAARYDLIQKFIRDFENNKVILYE